MASSSFPSGYRIRRGSDRDRILLTKFLQQTYAELFPGGNFAHLSQTIDYYLSDETPIWWVEWTEPKPELAAPQLVGCLWLGNAIDQASGGRYAHIFLLYVAPAHRRQGIGAALVNQAETWAKARGDRQIGLQVFESNVPALTLYRNLGYQPQSLWMIKPLE